MLNPNNRFLSRLLLALALSVYTAAGAWGAENANASLAKRVDRLSAKVQALEATVKKLEAQIRAQQHGSPVANAATPTVGSAPKAALKTAPTVARPTTPPAYTRQAPAQNLELAKSRWERVKKGMTAKQVRALLGEPSQTMVLNGRKVWYYRYPNVGGGSIMFGADATVAGWQHPPWTWW